MYAFVIGGNERISFVLDIIIIVVIIIKHISGLLVLFGEKIK